MKGIGELEYNIWQTPADCVYVDGKPIEGERECVCVCIHVAMIF